MKFRWIAVALAGAVLFSAGSADAAAPKHKKHWKYYTRQYCREPAIKPSLGEWFFGVRPKPDWNGCAPAVYKDGEFLGQDPDSNARATLNRDPSQGYTDRY